MSFSRLYGLLRAKSDKGEERSVPFQVLNSEAETEERTKTGHNDPAKCLGEFERKLPIGMDERSEDKITKCAVIHCKQCPRPAELSLRIANSKMCFSIRKTLARGRVHPPFDPPERGA